MPSPAYANNSGNPVFAATNSVLVNVPASTANNDLLIAEIWQEAAGAAAPTCAGWTQRFSIAGGSTALYLFTRIASSEPANYTFTSSNATAISGWIHRVTGAVTAGNPFNAIGSGDTASGTTSITASAITTTVANTLLMCFVGKFDGSLAVSSYQSGWTGVSFTGNSTMVCSYIAQAAAGSTGTATTTFVSNDEFTGVIAAIAPSGGSSDTLMGQICL